MSRFVSALDERLTRTVPLGPCDCPGAPHKDGDTAEVYRVLGWDDMVDIGGALTDGASRRILVTRAIASWTLEERNGDGTNHPVPIVESTVRLLDKKTLTALAESVNEAHTAASLPNASGEESPPSPSATDPTPTTQTPAKPTS
jgi:hypothetical protein